MRISTSGQSQRHVTAGVVYVTFAVDDFAADTDFLSSLEKGLAYRPCRQKSNNLSARFLLLLVHILIVICYNTVSVEFDCYCSAVYAPCVDMSAFACSCAS